MENTSPIFIIESQIRDSYVKILWTHKIQEKSADLKLVLHRRLKVLQIVLSALTTTSILYSLFKDNQMGAIIGAVAAATLFGIDAYTKDYDLGAAAQKHANTALQLLVIREKYLSLLTDIKCLSINLEAIVERRDNLLLEYTQILTSAPRTNDSAVKEASKALNKNKDSTITEDEAEGLLPDFLKRRSTNN
jgi:hypothetical protein